MYNLSSYAYQLSSGKEKGPLLFFGWRRINVVLWNNELVMKLKPISAKYMPVLNSILTTKQK